MAQRIFLSIFLAIFIFFGFTLFAFAGEFTVFGPKNYQRETGEPVSVTDTFTILNPQTQFILRVYNGGLVDTPSDLVSSSIIILNGQQVLSPNNFNQNVNFIEIPVILKNSNMLSIELRGAPGGLIAVKIVGKDDNTPTMQIIQPLDNTLTNQRPYPVKVNFSDDISGINPTSYKCFINNVDATLKFTVNVSGLSGFAAADISFIEGTNNITIEISDWAGNSISSTANITTDYTPPQIPIGLTATSGDTIVDLTWQANTESDLAGYNIYRSSISGLGYIKINSTIVTTNVYQDTGLINDITYYYMISAIDKIGNESGYSIGVSATPTVKGAKIIKEFPMLRPVDLVVDSQNNLYILESGRNQIVVYDKDDYYLKTIELLANEPKGMALDKQGNLYIIDTGNNRIMKYKLDGTLDTTFGNQGIVGELGNGDGQFNEPWGISVDGEGIIYVTDSGNNRIQKFASSGKFLTKWGIFGSEPEQFNQPRGIFIDGTGHIFVADTGNNRIQEFSSSGSLWNVWQSTQTFNQPIDISKDSYYLYVVDTGNNSFQKFNNETYQFISKIDNLNLSNPQGIAIYSDKIREIIYIADTENNRVIKVEIPIVSPKITWDKMKEALRQKNIEGALVNFTEEAKEEYRRIFILLIDELPRIIEEMQDIYPISLRGDVAEYLIKRIENGTEKTYFIYMIKDKNGEWKIHTF